MMQAYIDTNILVDLVLARQEFLPDAQRVFALGYAGEVQPTVSALSFVNRVFNILYPENCKKPSGVCRGRPRASPMPRKGHFPRMKQRRM